MHLYLAMVGILEEEYALKSTEEAKVETENI
jgi:hypothetical protein